MAIRTQPAKIHHGRRVATPASRPSPPPSAIVQLFLAGASVNLLDRLVTLITRRRPHSSWQGTDSAPALRHGTYCLVAPRPLVLERDRRRQLDEALGPEALPRVLDERRFDLHRRRAHLLGELDRKPLVLVIGVAGAQVVQVADVGG